MMKSAAMSKCIAISDPGSSFAIFTTSLRKARKANCSIADWYSGRTSLIGGLVQPSIRWWLHITRSSMVRSMTQLKDGLISTALIRQTKLTTETPIQVTHPFTGKRFELLTKLESAKKQSNRVRTTDHLLHSPFLVSKKWQKVNSGRQLLPLRGTGCFRGACNLLGSSWLARNTLKGLSVI